MKRIFATIIFLSWVVIIPYSANSKSLRDKEVKALEWAFLDLSYLYRRKGLAKDDVEHGKWLNEIAKALDADWRKVNSFPVLYCTYVDDGPGMAWRYYWFRKIPEGISSIQGLSLDNPLKEIGQPRTKCPTVCEPMPSAGDMCD